MAANASAASWSVFALELDRADNVPRRPRLDPAPHQRQQPVRIGDDVAEQPVHRLRRQPKALSRRRVTPGIAATAGSSGALSTAVTLAPSLATPRSSRRGGAEIQARLSRRAATAPNRVTPPTASGRRGWAARYGLDKAALAIDERAGSCVGLASSRSGASRVQAPRCESARLPETPAARP